MLLYTDGVPDATGPQSQCFGMERLRRVILENRHASAAELLVEIERAIGEFTGATEQFDDSAIMIAKRL
jgi:sigma-B regulation protein RsbU (phosphoserine phosphatase)